MITLLVASNCFIHFMCLAWLLYMSIYIYTLVCIYNYDMYRWHNYRFVSIYAISCYLCSISLVVHVTAVICIYADDKQLLIYLCHWSCPIISLHPTSYNFERYGFYLIVWMLCDDLVSLIVMIVINLWQSLLMFVYLCRLWYC